MDLWQQTADGGLRWASRADYTVSWLPACHATLGLFGTLRVPAPWFPGLASMHGRQQACAVVAR